jgi:hypothetical protein
MGMSVMEFGRFTYDSDSGTVTGPAKYMAERFPQFQQEVKAGRAESLTACSIAAGANGQQADGWQLFMQALQLDYAGWHGVDSLLSAIKPRKAKPEKFTAEGSWHVHCHTTGWQKVPGKIVSIDGTAGYTFVLHETIGKPGSFTVSEASSGMAVAYGDTQQAAVRKARELVWDHRQKLEQAVQDAIDRQGAAPEFGGMALRKFAAGDPVTRDHVMSVWHGVIFESANGVLMVRRDHAPDEPLTAAWKRA